MWIAELTGRGVFHAEGSPTPSAGDLPTLSIPSDGRVTPMVGAHHAE